jgi:type I restriction enzyme S subunit
MTEWPQEPFEAVVADESSGNIKTPQSEFKESGRYPIIDQGKELIAGYTDDVSRLCRAELPVIVFGDHTRCFKYVDFPFCIGADGVKVLRPKIEADVKYLYHYLCSMRLTDGGYDRHFKYLKRSSITLPPLTAQRRIAAILDKADALRAKRRTALAQLDTLAQSTFLDFHRGTESLSRRIPLSDLAEPIRGSFVNGPFGSDLLTSELQDEGVPVIYIRDIRDGKYARVSTSYVSDRKAKQLAVCAVAPGDVLVAKVGDPPGTAAVYPDQEPAGVVTQDVIRIRVSRQNAAPEFVAAYLNASIGRCKVAGITIEATRARFSLKDFKALMIEVPPITLQQSFVRKVTSIDALKDVHNRSLMETDTLFASLQHRAFNGSL